MLSLKDKEIFYDFSQCQQCGTCEAVCPQSAISLRRLNNGLCNVIVNKEACVLCKRCIKVCPSAMETVGKEDYLPFLAKQTYFFAYNEDKPIRRKASSGGACRTIIIESLRSGAVDGVYSLRKCEEYPQAEGCFYTKENIPTYDDLPNSVYHSLMIGRKIKEVKKCHTLMLVGTSCQLRSLEAALNGKYDELIKICIFCKQQKTLASTRFLAKAMGTNIPKGLMFSSCYRGDGWPGTVRINGKSLQWKRATMLPFGRRLWCVPGCDVCGDPFGIEAGADMSLMDPWDIREENNLGETVITVYSGKGLDLLRATAHLVLEEKQYEEIEPTFGLGDVWRKRKMVPFFRGEKCEDIIRKAGKAELFQRWYLRKIVEILPRMPILFYRILAHAPELRNKILKFKK